jgi:hypothetical protein
VYDSLSYDTPPSARVLALCLLDQAFFYTARFVHFDQHQFYIIEVEEPPNAEYHLVSSVYQYPIPVACRDFVHRASELRVLSC